MPDSLKSGPHAERRRVGAAGFAVPALAGGPVLRLPRCSSASRLPEGRPASSSHHNFLCGQDAGCRDGSKADRARGKEELASKRHLAYRESVAMHCKAHDSRNAAGVGVAARYGSSGSKVSTASAGAAKPAAATRRETSGDLRISHSQVDRPIGTSLSARIAA